MNNIMLLLALKLFLIACISEPNDHGEIEELDKEKVQQLYCNKEGIDCEKHKTDICVQIPDQFKHVAAVGLFAHDRGCKGNAYYFDGEFITLKELTPKALEFYGWKEPSKREELALKWVKHIIVVWESPLNYLPKGFSEKEFYQPMSWTEEDKVKVKLWIQEPAGMRNESKYRAEEYTFDTEGNLENIRSLGSKTISGN
ncbi:MAG: hypothetical protein R2799_13420 [Crocinitomicaceae bacterium]